MLYGSFSKTISSCIPDNSIRFRFKLVTIVSASHRVHRMVLPEEIFSEIVFVSNLSSFSQTGHIRGSFRIVIISLT